MPAGSRAISLRPDAQLQARFISDIKARIGKSITFGCSQPSHYKILSYSLNRVTRHWRALAVGVSGYLTTSKDAGIYRQKIAWGDHDQMGHVNNVRYNYWAETARINWTRNLAMCVRDPAQRKAWNELVTPKGIGLILKSITTEYKIPLRYPDRVSVYHKLLRSPSEGMDSLQLEAVVLSDMHQRVAAKITEDIVVYDYRIGKRVALPGFMVDTLQEVWNKQGSAIRGAFSDINYLNDEVRRVERQTWDRTDAVEDLGSATGSSPAEER